MEEYSHQEMSALFNNSAPFELCEKWSTMAELLVRQFLDYKKGKKCQYEKGSMLMPYTPQTSEEDMENVWNCKILLYGIEINFLRNPKFIKGSFPGTWFILIVSSLTKLDEPLSNQHVTTFFPLHDF